MTPFVGNDVIPDTGILILLGLVIAQGFKLWHKMGKIEARLESITASGKTLKKSRRHK